MGLESENTLNRVRELVAELEQLVHSRVTVAAEERHRGLVADELFTHLSRLAESARELVGYASGFEEDLYAVVEFVRERLPGPATEQAFYRHWPDNTLGDTPEEQAAAARAIEAE